MPLVPPRLRSLALGLLLVAGCTGPLQPVFHAEAPVGPEPHPASYFTVGTPPVYTTEGVRIGTFNGEFLFDGRDGDGGATFAWKDDSAAARAHMEDVAAVIRTLDADLLLIPETENLGVLETMTAEMLAGLGYTPYLVNGQDSFTGQDVGLLSRLPIEEVGRINERAPVGLSNQTYGVSKNLWARLTLAGVPTTLVGVHFLARPDDTERKDRREAQAEVIRRFIAQEAAAGRAIVVLGDLNDFDDVTLDARASRPITDVLARIKRAGPSPDDDLTNVLGEVPQARRFTALYDRNRNDEIEEGELSAIDHVLLSPALYTRLREVHFVHAHDPRVVSDHFPIIVTLAE
ncbi:MAG: endonuclease/exonuclease/phosphatase family protein [Rhodothermaceae bacterium]|nr:endonuclease/exonuclease/phosphatase family protein [Rhodothermaceae bacterium]